MNGDIQNLMRELKGGLRLLYASRLEGVYLFGSYAREQQDVESDVDVLVVLDRIDRYGAEVDRASYLTAELSLKYGVSISTVFAEKSQWLSADTSFFANVREEAIAA